MYEQVRTLEYRKYRALCGRWSTVLKDDFIPLDWRKELLLKL
jgi:hypothetical protein